MSCNVLAARPQSLLSPPWPRCGCSIFGSSTAITFCVAQPRGTRLRYWVKASQPLPDALQQAALAYLTRLLVRIDGAEAAWNAVDRQRPARRRPGPPGVVPPALSGRRLERPGLRLETPLQ
jgi:hypothetical protein